MILLFLTYSFKFLIPKGFGFLDFFLVFSALSKARKLVVKRVCTLDTARTPALFCNYYVTKTKRSLSERKNLATKLKEETERIICKKKLRE